MLSVQGLVKRFSAGPRGRAPVLAVDGLSLDLGEGQLVTILGPSGCGKTTTLRCIAGLETPDEGRIEVSRRIVFAPGEVDVPASRRGLGMVFQSYGIWPHMDVFGNVAFPLVVLPRQRRLSKKEIHERVERILAVVQLDDLAHRPATELSGGQQQRLALARALVTEPPVLLLDEPLSNLDARLRDEMRFELKRLQRELGVTTVLVTHDQVEALTMSGAVAVMRAGRIVQIGSPEEIYEAPASRFVANFIGAANVIGGVVERAEGHDVLVKTAEGTLRGRAPTPVDDGGAVAVVIRPERIRMETAGDDPPGTGRWVGVVRDGAYLGECVDHMVAVGSALIRVRSESRPLSPRGSPVVVHLPPEACVVIPDET